MWRRRRNLGTLLGGAALAAGVYYANRIEPARVEVRERSLVLRRLDKEFDGYRLALIGDIHMDGWMTPDRITSILGLLNEQEPDLVAISGDYVTDTVALDSRELSNALSQIEAKDGVVGVLGNHDYLADQRMIRRLIHESGIVELANDVYTVHRGDAALHVAGVDNFRQRKARLDLVLEKLPEEGAAVLLAHEPDFADVSAATGRFDLQLSGHSHGGQVRLPFVGPVVRPLYGMKYPDGLYEVDGMLQYTNRGLGLLGAHLRFNCRPEITILTLLAPL
ncbi:MAG: metallophosphoesterase [Actinomycetota bacterium]|nr:metallophosphoesterase [Actinomycetota bacterium]